MIFSFENMSVSKKVNYLLRKYDLFIQKYSLFKESYVSASNNFKKRIITHSFPKKAIYLQPLETGSAMEASRTELPGRFAREAQGGPMGPIYPHQARRRPEGVRIRRMCCFFEGSLSEVSLL